MRKLIPLAIVILAGCATPSPETTVETRAVYVVDGRRCGVCGKRLTDPVATVIQVPDRPPLFAHPKCYETVP